MSLFGSKPATSAFGQTTASPFGGTNVNANKTSIFGQVQPANQTQNAFGTSCLFGQSQPQQQQQQNGSQVQQPQRPSLIWEENRESPNQKPITEQCLSVGQKWNPAHPNTVFKYYFYNKVDQSRVPFYQPGPMEDAHEWEEAVRNKPGPGFMPALATGFVAVAERLKMQRAVLGQYNARMHEINNCLDAILSKHDLETSVRAINARRKHALLRQRCLALASKVQVLRNRGYALDTDEDDLKTKLETLERGMSDPALSARTEELWSRLILLRGHADTLKNEINSRGGDAGEAIPEEAEAKAKKLLEDYDKQLQALKSAVGRIKEDYDEWEKERNPNSKDTPSSKR
ncbi:nucleoporin complex subunit 54-domain-containing protein [Pseudomassariella vexata]|uniref:Nucleoporin complex subunit 54-domain-containing protein n=1 Tax=Pseudomassariella vexata TaxID=1141098 RepID=A0A1Y2E8P3_9PEZI|nr:nucleoporin complex subunit 54-domain-containing protein [Pseudomassariella vexata]ORY67797.1 nucleoporin complex subunit 54-domain-containing protein [Pseudomassariella vexata]